MWKSNAGPDKKRSIWTLNVDRSTDFEKFPLKLEKFFVDSSDYNNPWRRKEDQNDDDEASENLEVIPESQVSQNSPYKTSLSLILRDNAYYVPPSLYLSQWLIQDFPGGGGGVPTPEGWGANILFSGKLYKYEEILVRGQRPSRPLNLPLLAQSWPQREEIGWGDQLPSPTPRPDQTRPSQGKGVLVTWWGYPPHSSLPLSVYKMTHT